MIKVWRRGVTLARGMEGTGGEDRAIAIAISSKNIAASSAPARVLGVGRRNPEQRRERVTGDERLRYQEWPDPYAVSRSPSP